MTKTTPNKDTRFGVRVTPETREQLDQIATAKGIGFSAVLREAIAAYVKKNAGK
jgi:predicted transcriptional regulator